MVIIRVPLWPASSASDAPNGHALLKCIGDEGVAEGIRHDSVPQAQLLAEPPEPNADRVAGPRLAASVAEQGAFGMAHGRAHGTVRP